MSLGEADQEAYSYNCYNYYTYYNDDNSCKRVIFFHVIPPVKLGLVAYYNHY